jgi:hypothetical protein
MLFASNRSLQPGIIGWREPANPPANDNDTTFDAFRVAVKTIIKK